MAEPEQDHEHRWYVSPGGTVHRHNIGEFSPCGCKPVTLDQDEAEEAFRDWRRAEDWRPGRPEPGDLERIGLTISDLVGIATGPMRELAERFAVCANVFEDTAQAMPPDIADDDRAVLLTGMARGLRLAAASIEDVIEA